jgi:hypothetical protein
MKTLVNSAKWTAILWERAHRDMALEHRAGDNSCKIPYSRQPSQSLPESFAGRGTICDQANGGSYVMAYVDIQVGWTTHRTDMPTKWVPRTPKRPS